MRLFSCYQLPAQYFIFFYTTHFLTSNSNAFDRIFGGSAFQRKPSNIFLHLFPPTHRLLFQHILVSQEEAEALSHVCSHSGGGHDIEEQESLKKKRRQNRALLIFRLTSSIHFLKRHYLYYDFLDCPCPHL